MLERLTLPKIVAVAAGLLVVLFAIGWMSRVDPSDKPYLKVLGGGFLFNYRIAEVTYGFTAAVMRPLPTGSIIEARFEDPAGGPEMVVRQRVGTDSVRYSLHSPPVTGVKADTAYSVRVTVYDREGSREIWRDTLSFKSELDGRIVPDRALTIGPGYARNPD